MNTIKINYDNDTDETGIDFSDEFNAMPPEQQLTVVIDGLSLLYTRFSALFNNIDELWVTYQRLQERKRNKATKRYVKDMWGD